MPNIELHGFELDERDEILCTSEKAAESIWRCLKDAPYLHEVVVTRVYSYSLNHRAEEQKFLRIWATSQRQVKDIIRRLKPLVIDIEVAPLLHSFIEKRSVTIGKDKDVDRPGKFWPTKHP